MTQDEYDKALLVCFGAVSDTSRIDVPAMLEKGVAADRELLDTLLPLWRLSQKLKDGVNRHAATRR